MKRVDVSTADGSQIICHYFDNELPSIGDILVIMEPDEEPLETAKRELEEETGYQADEWIFLTEKHLSLAVRPHLPENRIAQYCLICHFVLESIHIK